MLVLYKKTGETPLECLERLRVEQPEYKDEILSYAGRLDPLAEGLLLVLVGEENKKRKEYLYFDKEYEVDILFGVATDTHDVLGLVTEEAKEIPEGLRQFVENKLSSFVGEFEQEYPAFSSKPINGVPLFEIAKSGMKDIEVPTKKVSIYSIEKKGWKMISKEALQKEIKEKVSLVKGDFRQKEIIAQWEAFFQETAITTFPVCTIEVTCSSGTYMRSLADKIGKKEGSYALAWRIKRMRVGEYKISGSAC